MRPQAPRSLAPYLLSGWYLPREAMYRILGSGSLIEIDACNRLTADDLWALRAELRRLADERGGRLRLLFQLDGSAGWPEAAAEPQRALDLEVERDVERVAVVLGKASARAARQLFRAASAGHTRVFHPSQEQAVWEWLSSPSATNERAHPAATTT